MSKINVVSMSWETSFPRWFNVSLLSGNYVHETAVMGFLIGSYGIINYITAVIYLFALIKIYFIYELHCCDECVQKN